MSVKNFKHLLILVLGLGLGDTQDPGPNFFCGMSVYIFN